MSYLHPDLDNAFENGKNGLSGWGQGYTGAFEGIAHAEGEAARAAENASKANTSISPSFIPYGSLPGGSYRAHPGGIIGPIGSNAGETISATILLVAALFGAYDNLANQRSVAETAGRAFGAVYAVSTIAGEKISSIDPDSTLISVVDGVRWCVGFASAVYAGIGAGVGNAVALVAKAGFSVVTEHSSKG